MNDKPRLIGDEMWRFQILYRKAEYYFNNQQNICRKLIYIFYKLRFRSKCRKLNSEIPFNIFQEGLVIWHGQNIIINGSAKVGKNCSISAGCVIGQAKGKAPVIGDNCELTIGSTILGNISIVHDVTIGARALVVKDIYEPFSTCGGFQQNLSLIMSMNMLKKRKKGLKK